MSRERYELLLRRMLKASQKSHLALNCRGTLLLSICQQCEKEDDSTKSVVPTF